MDTYIICEEYGKLRDVVGHFLEEDGIINMLISLELVFENGKVFHEAIPETDQISVRQAPPSGECVALPIAESEPWSFAIGRQALWVWKLQNQNGYGDGLQYSFANTVSDEEVVVQLMVIGSEVTVHRVAKSHNKRL
ncbi:DUF6334 family protein [Microbulbifer agarilyticus]